MCQKAVVLASRKLLILFVGLGSPKLCRKHMFGACAGRPGSAVPRRAGLGFFPDPPIDLIMRSPVSYGLEGWSNCPAARTYREIKIACLLKERKSYSPDIRTDESLSLFFRQITIKSSKQACNSVSSSLR